ncbi:MAG: P-loop NTPase fold protein [Prochlorothrix sp.]|nr:P-loop NTPase fold protein [Prochlorothrix sp.]
MEPPRPPRPSKGTLPPDLEQTLGEELPLDFEPNTGQDAGEGWATPQDAVTGQRSVMYRSRVVQTHRDGVQAVAFSPDGQTLLSGDRSGEIRIWDRAGTRIDSYDIGQQAGLVVLAFSADARTIVSGGEDSRVRLWDLEGHLLAQSLQGHPDQVKTVAVSQDGAWVASGGDDRTIRLWDREGNALGTLRDLGGWASVLAFSPMEPGLVSGGADRKLYIWDLDSQLLTKTVLAHRDRISSLAFSPDGQKIVSGSLDQTLKIWDRRGAACGPPIQAEQGAVTALAFSPDGGLLVSGGEDGSLCLWDASGNALGEPLEGHGQTVNQVAFSPDGRMFVSGSEDGSVRLWGQVERVAVPQSLSNDLAEGEDRLFIRDELDALASVLMLRQLQPPLAVGILGNWGSGKSFAMHLIRQHLNTIRAQPLAEAEAWGPDLAQRSPYVGHIYQIRFDAWSYAKANLWASLMETIFTELDRKISLEQHLVDAGVDLLQGGKLWETLQALGADQLAVLLKDERLSAELFQDPKIGQSWSEIGRQSDRSAALWQRLSELRRQDREDLEQLEQSVHDLEKQVQGHLMQIEAEVDQSLYKTAREQAMEPLDTVWQDLLGNAAQDLKQKLMSEDPGETAKVRAILEEIDPQFFRSIFRACRSNPWLVLAFIGSIALAFMTPWLLDNMTLWGPVGDRLMALLANTPLFAVGFPLGQKVWTAWKQHRRQVQEVWHQYQERVQVQQERLASQREAQIAALKQRRDPTQNQAPSVADLESQLRQQRAYLAQRRSQVSVMAEYSSLTEFVSDRLQSNAYQEQLGLIHQVRRDMEELSDRLVMHPDDPVEIQREKRKLFPRGDARVVLYIDDLDRCPPDRVVAVLEAVQLLLKTQLFIVVLAIDDRYIARALEDVYQGVLKRRGKPSGIDYLEKIIQIPYRMRPISPVNVESYLSAQVQMQSRVAHQELGPVGIGQAGTELTEAERLELEPVEIEGAEQQAVELTEAEPRELELTDARSTEVQLADKSSRNPISPDSGSQPIDQSTDSLTDPLLPAAPVSQSQASLSTPLAGFSRPRGMAEESEGYLGTIAEVTTLDPAEFDLLVTCCNSVDITPRTAKRLINIYKILKIIWAKRSEPNLHAKQVVMVFLAMSARYPDLMRDLLGELDAQFEEQGAGDTANPTLDLLWGDLRQTLYPQVGESNLHVQREWRRFESDVQRTLGKRFSLDRSTFYLVLSFCFVGDIGYDPTDYDL